MTDEEIYDEVRRRPPYIVDRAINVAVRDPCGPRSGERRGSSSAAGDASQF